MKRLFTPGTTSCLYRTIALAILALIYCGPALAGKYSITGFNRANGFPGNNIYHIFQDTRHYIWMGTENGLVCFNGYEFKTYTTADGLPDNEVFRINEDAMGRLWLITFSNEMSYIWKGQIFNARNSALVKRLQINRIPQSMEIDREKNIWIGETGSITRMDTNGKVWKFRYLEEEQLSLSFQMMLDSLGRILVLNGRKIYRFDSDRFRLVLVLPPRPGYQYHRGSYLGAVLCEYSWTPLPLFMKHYKSNKSNYYGEKGWDNLTYFRKWSDSQVGVGTAKGFFIRDFPGGRTKEQLLPGKKVTWCLPARDGSLWIGTIGTGIFHCVRSMAGAVVSPEQHAVLSIGAVNGQVYYTTNVSSLNRVNLNPNGEAVSLPGTKIDPDHPWEFCTYAGQDSRRNWIIAMFGEISKYSRLDQRPVQRYLVGACKQTFDQDARHLLLATSTGIYRLDKERFGPPEQLYEGRTTSIVQLEDIIYAGTLDGLLAIYPDKPHTAAPVAALHNRHITTLATEGDSILWVADNNATLTALHNKRVIAVIDKRNGIVCKKITTVKVWDRKLWVGTDNGLFVLGGAPHYPVLRHLTRANGLSDDQVNCIRFASGRMWIGTDRGLNYFADQQTAPAKDRPLFFVTGAKSDDRDLAPEDSILRVSGKTLTLHFDVVDHSVGARPAFSYRQDNGPWQSLENNNLYFPTLPYGHSTLQLRARSPFWPGPALINLKLYKDYPYYWQWWFLLLCCLSLLLTGYGLFRLLLSRARKKDRERLLHQENLLQLEQLALQGQMNTHFIFNCIAAIGQYYNEGDRKRADEFVANFSALVRTNFEMENQTFASLEDELKYIDQYLTVERERLDHAFAFTIHTEITDPASQIPVPTMLLQPLVENAVRHGIRHLPDGKGRIGITVAQTGTELCITITDNGIGRSRSRELQQAYGRTPAKTSTRVNERRIDILNRLFDYKIDMHTSDIFAGTAEVAGTRVVITYSKLIYDFTPKPYSADYRG